MPRVRLTEVGDSGRCLEEDVLAEDLSVTAREPFTCEDLQQGRFAYKEFARRLRHWQAGSKHEKREGPGRLRVSFDCDRCQEGRTGRTCSVTAYEQAARPFRQVERDFFEDGARFDAVQLRVRKVELVHSDRQVCHSLQPGAKDEGELQRTRTRVGDEGIAGAFRSLLRPSLLHRGARTTFHASSFNPPSRARAHPSAAMSIPDALHELSSSASLAPRDTANRDAPTVQSEAARLTRLKKNIEAQLDAYYDVLKNVSRTIRVYYFVASWLTARLGQNNCTMETPLVDREGYPRSDIDVAGVRTARHHVIRLRNDLKAVMNDMEQIVLQGLPRGEEAPQQDTAMEDVVQTEASDDKPFAKVDAVAPNSPANQAVSPPTSRVRFEPRATQRLTGTGAQTGSPPRGLARLVRVHLVVESRQPPRRRRSRRSLRRDRSTRLCDPARGQGRTDVDAEEWLGRTRASRVSQATVRDWRALPLARAERA